MRIENHETPKHDTRDYALARVLAILLFLFWGAFFLEHLSEWFIKPFPQTPPPTVWLRQALHLTLLIALLISLKWHLFGSILIIISAALFFPAKGALPWLFVIIAPALVFLACHLLRQLSHK